MYRKLLAFAFGLFLLALAAVPAQAATFSEPDNDAHPYVGTLLFQQADGLYSCTATLLSSTVLLTAGHCTESGNVENIATWVSFDEQIDLSDRPAGSIVDYLDATWIRAEDVIPHPEYSDFAQFPHTFDIGLVVLNEADAIILDEYGQLPEIGLLEGLRTRQERRFTVVGYGLQGYIKPFYGDAYERRKSTTYLVEVNSTYNGAAHSAKFTNNPGANGGTCYGDSGGPILYQDSNIIGAVTSFGFTPCIGVDFNFRVDTELAHDFIASHDPELVP